MKIKFYQTTPLAKLFPPVPCAKVIPHWYKKMDAEVANVQKLAFANNLSVKRCVPVLDYMTSGYIIKNYTDILVKKSWSDENGEELSLDFKQVGDQSPVDFHSASQMPLEINNHKKKIGKFTGVWGIETPPGYSCLFYQPEYLREERFKIFPGIVDTDQYTDPIGFPFVFNNEYKTEEYVIEAGTPIACVLPFKREKWTHEILEHDKDNKTSILMQTIWNNAYRRFMHSKKEYK
jgi:hypothetical protein